MNLCALFPVPQLNETIFLIVNLIVLIIILSFTIILFIKLIRGEIKIVTGRKNDKKKKTDKF